MTPMSICVAGWYLEKFDEFYMVMHRLNEFLKYPVYVVSHRDSPFLLTMDLPYSLRENTGLEWGAYNYYLMHVWDGESNVLFCHDDIIMHPFVVNGEVQPPENVFKNIADMDVDQAYIFSSRSEDVHNYSRHGRMVFMSQRFLAKAKEIGGFRYDKKNNGYTEGSKPELREKMGCLGYNYGIISFHAQAEAIGGNVHRRAYIPCFGMAVRGEVKSEKLGYGKWLAHAKEFAAQAKDKLHLGCGTNHWEGYTNVDLHDDSADVKADVRSLPFADNSFDWIESHHLLEHLGQADAISALKEWQRVLRPGGHMFVTCPDLVACSMALKDSSENPALWAGLARAVYGVDEPGMLHKFGYCRNSLTAAMQEAGYQDVEVKTAIGYRPTPSLLGIGRKE